MERMSVWHKEMKLEGHLYSVHFLHGFLQKECKLYYEVSVSGGTQCPSAPDIVYIDCKEVPHM